MPRTNFSNALRGVLNRFAATDLLIDKCCAIELKESDVAQYLPNAVNTMRLKKTEFATALDQAVTGLGAVWNGTFYAVNGMGLPIALRQPATEELSAIRTHAPTVGYDPAKALTNMLRLIKAAER